MSRAPLLSLVGEYLIYGDAWAMQYHGKCTEWRPLLVVPRECSVAPKGPRAPS